MNSNIEKTILSSIISAGADVYKAQKYIDLLQVDDFMKPQHRLIFSAIQQLEKTNMPIHTDFIVRITQDEQALTEVLMINPAMDIEPYSLALKQDRAKRELQKALDQSLQGEIDLEKIQAQLNRLQDQNSTGQKQKIDDKFIDFFDKYNLDREHLENLKTEYLYENFIVKNEVTMFAAKPSSGKSLTTLALVNMALSKNKVEYVFYFDLDNSLTTLKERDIGSLRQKWGKRLIYIHPSFVEKPIIWRMIRELQKRDLSESLVVFDSAKNFMIGGGDRDKNKDVSKVTEIFKSLRNKGATVLFLHHTNKPQQAINELTYAGSSAWEEDSSNAFILHKNDFKKTFIFTPIKNRVGELNMIAFQYQNDHILIPFDATEASETEEIQQINSEIIDFIEGQTQKPSYGLIMQHLQKLGYPRNRSNEALQNGKNRYWSEEKLTQNNRSVFTLLKQPVVVEFQTISQDREISADESDKSDESYFRASFASDYSRTSADECQIYETNIAHSLTAPPQFAMPVI